jgi:ABC-type transporter Mla MlaB component
MATKDNSPGLLAKVAKFVRHPTRDWSDLDHPEPPPENGYTKQALKEMIERKRQNDFVRRREFDHLRKLRRNGPVMPGDQAGRPSFFQSSLASNVDERAMTIKKIDEIEAQMSKQWWKGKQDHVSEQSGLVPPARLAPPVDVAAASQPWGGESSFAPTQPLSDSSQMRTTDYEPTQMGLSAATLSGGAHVAPSMVAGRRSGSRNFEVGFSDFSSSNLFAIEITDDLNDPDLEEAAIRFANGDDAGAEAGLLAALQSARPSSEALDAWAAALFDLYRGTGQQARFDRLTLDYTQWSGRAAPAWFSTPDLLGQPPPAVPVMSPIRHTAWLSPVMLDFSALQALRLHLAEAPMPWHLHWHALKDVTPEAARELASLLADWCVQPVRLHFEGAEVLERVLRSRTPSGDRGVEKHWWRLRLDALRILRLQDEFELAALDYCVTYELSPPPWTLPRCEYVQAAGLAAPSGDAMNRPAGDDVLVQGENASAHGLDTVPVTVVELSGEVLGDAGDVLNSLQAGRRADQLTIACSRLIRVDFSAAGSILNWVSVRAAEGCEVQFTDVPRLVAAFFHVIGINEHARVVLRAR